MRKSDSVNRESLKLTRKADSIAEQALIHSITADAENASLAIIKNVGKTPAYKVTAVGGVRPIIITI